jgi:magnesium-transporting ATPase (P-type)
VEKWLIENNKRNLSIHHSRNDFQQWRINLLRMISMNDTDAKKVFQSTYIENGLETEEVQKRRAEYGYNEVPEKKVSFWRRLGKRFWGIVPWMLEATAIITLILGKYPQALVIVFLLFFNAGMSLWREGRAKAAMARLKQRLRIQCRVFYLENG